MTRPTRTNLGNLVPTLRVGTHAPTLRVARSQQSTTRRRAPSLHSHAERGNEQNPPTLRVALLTLLLAALLLLAGCETPTATPAPTAPPPVAGETNVTAGNAAAAATATPVPLPAGTVTLWHSWAGADADALTAILTDFRAAYPDVTVETLFVSYDDLPQAYADAVAAGGGPDLVFTPNWWVDDLVRAGAALPLDGVLAPDQLTGYYPAALDNLRADGVLYGLPVTVETAGLYVNNALLAQGGVPATTADWLAAVQADPTAGAASGGGIYLNLYHLIWGFPAYGARLMDDDGLVVLDQGDGAAQFLSWLHEMSQTQGNFVSFDYGMLLDRYKKGEFPFFIDGPWAAADLRQALGDTLTVAPLPAGPAGPAQPWLSADGLVLNPAASQTQQALALLTAWFITNQESGARWAQVAGRIPAQRDADLGGDPVLTGFAAQAATAMPMPTRPEMEQVWGYGGDMLLKVVNDVLAPADAVAEAAALINEANRK